ncbi:hypothetical protein CRUP_027302 [Coryphaenoides rupestris]|nr:hypothetical protein CRUP_027302 [Coryphaenoides rupestris]
MHRVETQTRRNERHVSFFTSESGTLKAAISRHDVRSGGKLADVSRFCPPTDAPLRPRHHTTAHQTTAAPPAPPPPVAATAPPAGSFTGALAALKRSDCCDDETRNGGEEKRNKGGAEGAADWLAGGHVTALSETRQTSRDQEGRPAGSRRADQPGPGGQTSRDQEGRPAGTMEPWMEVKEEEDLERPFRFEGLRNKTRFSFAEIKLLLEEVKSNRFVVLKTGRASPWRRHDSTRVLSVRQIMKKWADLKCDARRRMLAMRAPKGHKKTLGPVEQMVQKILLMAPGKEFYESYPEINFDLINDETMPIDFEEEDEQPLPDSKPSYSSSSYTSFPPPPPPPYPPPSNGTSSFHASSSSSIMPPPFLLPPPRPVAPPLSAASAPPPSPPPPPPPPCVAPPPVGGAHERLARVAAQSLQQQQVGGALLGSVSRSLELLAQAVQQLVETQQDFIQESLELQRHTLDILKDFSHSTLALLRDRQPSSSSSSSASSQGSRHPACTHTRPTAPTAPTACTTLPPPEVRTKYPRTSGTRTKYPRTSDCAA